MPRWEARDRTIGRGFVAASVDALRSLGIRKCHLFLFRDNADGKAFWTSLGWDGQWEGVEIVSRTLAP